MIFMLRRALFANEHSHIQEIADCHHFLLWSRVHRSLHSRQILVMKRMKIWDLIWCIWGLYLGISKLPINSKSENFVIQTMSSAETACSLAKAWQWWHSPQRSPGQGTDLLIMCPQKRLNSSFAGRCSMKNLWPLHEIFRFISCFLKRNHSSYQKLSVETGMRQIENRMISLSYHISCQHLWGTGHPLAHITM